MICAGIRIRLLVAPPLKLSPILVLQYAIKNAFRLSKSKFRNSNRSLDNAIV